MTEAFGTAIHFGLENHGLKNLKNIFWSLPADQLLDLSVADGEGALTEFGALVVLTGKHTGRSPNDKFTVRVGASGEKIWWGDVNRSISEEQFDLLHAHMIAHYEGKEAYVMDASAAAHPDYRMKVRVVTEQAWHSLFARNMFIPLPESEQVDYAPEFTIIHAPSCQADPAIHGTKTEAFIVINFEKHIALIGGTIYAGEIKKTIFTVLNYYLPLKGVLTMHCSANIGRDNDVALFFGLSGTGKTTLSSDLERTLIGDDEHGWGEDGIFNFEGGCYAKAIRLREDLEPIIYAASHRAGTILENVVLDPETGKVDFDDARYTKNTRSSYPIHFLKNYEPSNRGGHPKHVFFLTADAFGVMPPISRLTREQAMYFFVSGYTSKLAGTEKGLGKEPQATFSACFGAPFLPLHPKVYANLLADKVEQHNVNVWLVNTGWTGGPFGVGERIHLPYTRAMVTAAMNGDLEDVGMREDLIFGLHVPESCPGVPDQALNPRETWEDKSKFDVQAHALAARFRKNFAQFTNEFSFPEGSIPGRLLGST